MLLAYCRFTCDLSHCDTLLRSCLQIDVVRANTSCESQLELLGPCQPLRSQVARMKGCSDDLSRIRVSIIKLLLSIRLTRYRDWRRTYNIRVGQVLVELGIVALLVGSHHKRVAPLLQKLSQP